MKIHFKVGDLICLKSGGPKMIVADVDGYGGCRCQWFDKARHVSEHFAGEVLEKADKEDVGLAESISAARKRVGR